MYQQNPIISVLQIFGIFLVVIGHSFYGCQNNIFIYTWIYSFHMPLFMFISGYLFKYTLKLKNISLSAMSLHKRNEFIKKKIKRLLVPYIVISTLAFFPKALMNKFAIRPIDISFNSFINMLIYPWDNVIIFFWFLPTLFIIFCIVTYICYQNIHQSYVFVIPILILLHLFNPLKDIHFLNISGVISYMIYFISGYYFCQQNIETVLKHPIITTCITLAISIFLINLPNFLGKDLLMAFNGILMSISIGQSYVKYNCHFFDSFFGASFAIYLFSWFPQVLAQQVFLSLTHAPWQIATVLAIISGIYIPLWIYKWIIKNKQKKYGKIIAFLTGQ